MKVGRNYRKLLAATTVSNLGDGVSQIAYPWLASAVTRNPLLIALIAVVQRLPWLLFTLPAGVVADRVDRRFIMIGANVARAAITVLVAIAIVGLGDDLPAPGQLEEVMTTNTAIYLALLVATLLLGIGEVLHDNAAQTFVPQIVAREHLEHANGRLYTCETVANQFVGPPLGGLLLAAGFALPFLVDAGTFAVAAALVALIATPRVRRDRLTPGAPRPGWVADLREGVRWLWRHPLLRPLAITLGLMNALSAMTTAAFVLFAQEVLGTNTAEYAVLSIVAAVGGLLGGWLAGSVASRFGAGTVLRVAMVVYTAVCFVIGALSAWPVVAALLAIELFAGVLWNVVTVSLRQAIIPDELLGRVNSVYRFFAWGAIPIGSLLGGAVVATADVWLTRETALRLPWFIAGGGYVVVLALYAFPQLTRARIDAARAAGATPAAAAPAG